MQDSLSHRLLMAKAGCILLRLYSIAVVGAFKACNKSKMKKQVWLRRRILQAVLIGTFALIVLNQVFPTVWFSPAIRARVVTPGGRPITGAIVAANWHITDWMRHSVRQLEISEVVTDNDGWFSIPQWGPQFIWYGKLLESEPTVRVFHPGFVPLVMNNTESGMARDAADSIIKFRMQDQELVLRPFYGSIVEYERELAAINHSLDLIVIPASGNKVCLKKDMPRLLSALQSIKDTLQQEGAGASIRPLTAYSTCGDAEESVWE